MKKRSVIIGKRHSTSISLEDIFWDELKEIAKSKHISISDLITDIDINKEGDNLSSAIRIYIINHLKNNSPS